jgi:hypothetical protein
VEDATPIASEDEKDEENLVAHGRHDEEVNGRWIVPGGWQLQRSEEDRVLGIHSLGHMIVSKEMHFGEVAGITGCC